jgi:hypothetical protein
MYRRLIQLAMVVPLVGSGALLAVCAAARRIDDHAPSAPERQALLKRVIANQHCDDAAVDIYEHIEHRQARRSAADSTIIQDQAFRVIPTGMGTDRIPVQPDGRPIDPVAYAEELRKLERALVWATNTNGRAQREALAKYKKKQKEREELVDATLDAFLFTWMGRETIGGQTLAKFHLDPNPAYKPSSRATGMFSHIRATVWLDESAAQLTRVDAEIFEDMAFGGGLLAKVYKGGRFILEQLETAPGIWLPVLYDYNFEGRKFLFAMGVHVRTTMKQYKRVGPPAEALQLIHAELSKVPPIPSDP